MIFEALPFSGSVCCSENGSEKLPDERHAHAAGAAPAAGKLRARDRIGLNAVVPENAVGRVVPFVDDDLAGCDAERVRAVVPLLALSVHVAAAAAVDEGHAVEAQMPLQDVLQRIVLFGDRKAGDRRFVQLQREDA